ncbi:TEX30 [Symbiodinium sp. CCMP2592]|nr:TEX30 [Symbiodinium sp. CCMP2592]
MMLSAHQKMVLGLAFSALLNLADFYSDVLVTLEYGCVISNSLEAACGEDVLQVNSTQNLTDGAEMTRAAPACTPHYWWLGISLTILIPANCVQAFMWTVVSRSGSVVSRSGSVVDFVIAFLQLSPFVDLYKSMNGEASESDKKPRSAVYKDLAAKICESAPQTFLQAYVIYIVGAHTDVLKQMSLAISLAAIGWGLSDPSNPVWIGQKAVLNHLEGRFVRRCLSGVYLALDVGCRSGAWAMAFSAGPRPFGILVAIAGLLVAYVAAAIVLLSLAVTSYGLFWLLSVSGSYLPYALMIGRQRYILRCRPPSRPGRAFAITEASEVFQFQGLQSFLELDLKGWTEGGFLDVDVGGWHGMPPKTQLKEEKKPKEERGEQASSAASTRNSFREARHSIPVGNSSVDALVCVVQDSPIGVIALHPWGPLGGSMADPHPHTVCRLFGTAGCTTVRFNFRGGIGSGAGSVEDVKAVAAWMTKPNPLPEAGGRILCSHVLIVGYSYGSIIGAAAAAEIPSVIGYAALGPPLDYGWALYMFNAQNLRAQAARSAGKPKLLVVGTTDEFCSMKSFQGFADSLPGPKEMHVIEGANHFQLYSYLPEALTKWVISGFKVHSLEEFAAGRHLAKPEVAPAANPPP